MADATISLQLCLDALLPALTDAGVSLDVLMGLASCPTQSSCLAGVTA